MGISLLNFFGADIHAYPPTSETLILKLSRLNQTTSHNVDIDLIKKAISLAAIYHEGQFRNSGEPYITHPIEVALMVSDYLLKTEAIIISLLHDTLEDTKLTLQQIHHEFGRTIAEGVELLSRNKPTGKITSAELLKGLWAEKKYELILIKLFDRLHNIQTISVKSPEKQAKIIKETLTYFLVLGEVLELPRLADALYYYCYQANINLGEIQISLDDFNLDSTLPGVLTFQNN